MKTKISTEPTFTGPKTFGICQAVVLMMSGKRVSCITSRAPDTVYLRLDNRSGGSGFNFRIKHIRKTKHESFDLEYFERWFSGQKFELCEDEASKQFEYKTADGYTPRITDIR